MLIEHLYDYPRRFTWPLEALSAALVGLATLNFGRAVINFGLQQRPLLSMVNQLALLRPILRWFQTTGGPVTSAAGLLPSLLWLLLALFVTQFLRNMLPTVRTSGRGMLVRWSGDWVPVQWTGLQALKITDAGDGHKFVVLAQTAPDQLTGWHRLYSLLYRFGWRRGFLITSAMQDSEELLREIMEELSRMAQLGTAAPIAIDDRKASPLFRLLLGRRQQPAPVVVDATSQALIGRTPSMPTIIRGSTAGCWA